MHRDLKPENIFLAVSRRADAAFTVKVLDFGIAKLVAEAQTHHTAAIGTPLWMAPEQTEAGGRICPATDVWALGLIAFRVLVGKPYWRVANLENASPTALMREVVFEPLVAATERARELGVELPWAFDAWFSRCVHRDIGARYQEAGAALTALDALLVGHPSVAAAPLAPTMAAIASTVQMRPRPLDSSSSGTPPSATMPMPEAMELVAPPPIHSLRSTMRTSPGQSTGTDGSAFGLSNTAVVGLVVLGFTVFGLIKIGKDEGWFGRSSKGSSSATAPESPPSFDRQCDVALRHILSTLTCDNPDECNIGIMRSLATSVENGCGAMCFAYGMKYGPDESSWQSDCRERCQASCGRLVLKSALTIASTVATTDLSSAPSGSNSMTSQVDTASDLAPDDRGFVDNRGGWGWGDRCWKHIKSGQLDWAKAECLRGMDMNPAAPQPRASLLYNLGIIEAKLGNVDVARVYFQQSLALRPNADVQAALDALPKPLP